MNAAWQRLQARVGLLRGNKLVAVGASCAWVVTPRLYDYLNPQSYAELYLANISLGTLKGPIHVGLWVENKGMTEIAQKALEPHPNEEGMTLISGTQTCGKTSAIFKECQKQGRMGFFVDLGDYSGKKDDEEKIDSFFAEALITNKKRADHSYYQQVLSMVLPLPDPKYALAGLLGVFKERANDKLVLVVDETQKVANEAIQFDGLLNRVCALSQFGAVVLIASEFAVAEYFDRMTHVAKRTSTVYARAPTAEEMLPHVQGRFQDFEDGAKKIVDTFEGSFELLTRLEKNRAGGVEGVGEWYMARLQKALELTKGGMMNEKKATSTGQAMLAAAELAFSDTPVNALDRNNLELAQVGASKVETVGSKLKASWATPLAGEVMNELLCDATTHAVMKRRVPKDLYDEFEEAIKHKCPAAQAKK